MLSKDPDESSENDKLKGGELSRSMKLWFTSHFI